MTKRLLLYITEGHSSVTVDATVSRQTSAADVPAMLAGMPDDDRAVLEAFCETVLMLRPAVTVDSAVSKANGRRAALTLWGPRR